MKLEDLPEFVKPYKVKGYDVRKRGNRYVLFKISSQRVKDKKYPVLKQEYIGVIDPDKGLIESGKNNINTNKVMVEYGFSNIICRNFIKDISNASFGSRDKSYVKLCIVYYIFGNIEERTLKLTHLTCNDEDCFNKALKITEDRLKKMSSCIDKILKEKINDENDFLYIVNASKMVMVDSNIKYIKEKEYPDSLKEVLNKYGLLY